LIYEFGLNRLAFQLQDDYLDALVTWNFGKRE
jgi:geranylgeranyl pyrophosphate synthase